MTDSSHKANKRLFALAESYTRTMARAVFIGGRKIGVGEPVFIIAEAGVNHNGKLSLAKKLVDAAANAGADAVKFQTFSPDELVTKDAGKTGYQKRNTTPLNPSSKEGGRRGGESQYEMLKRLVLPRKWHAVLKQHAEKKGLLFLSTPFSFGDAAFLRRLGVSALKVGSSDANNFPYLRRIAAWGLPLILSTGMADMKEIREAVGAIRNPSIRPRRNAPFSKGRMGPAPMILMHCTTNYPTPFSEANVRAIRAIQKEFGFPVGFSDHTLGYEAACAAIALGACVIEKHFTLDKSMPGPDHTASLESDELKDFVAKIRNVEAALGTGNKIPFKSERKIALLARKSVVTLRAIKKGERLTEQNLGIKRPGTGLPPKEYDFVIGTRATRDIPGDALLKRHDYAA